MKHALESRLLSVGDALPATHKVVTRDMIEAYGAMVEGEGRNPIHYDSAAARAAGYREVIAHGTMSLGLVSESLAQTLGAHWLRSSTLSAKFIRPVFLGDDITVRGSLARIEESDGRARLVFEIRCENQAGEPVIAASATALVPLSAVRPGPADPSPANPAPRS
jgi:3-hydroxybutyryl-CoA dehydratase